MPVLHRPEGTVRAVRTHRVRHEVRSTPMIRRLPVKNGMERSGTRLPQTRFPIGLRTTPVGSAARAIPCESGLESSRAGNSSA